MKIGIFGDSFAIGHEPTKPFHWYNLLAEKLDSKVHTYGMGATSTFYSYKNFMLYHWQYDLNIFLVTSYPRYTKPLYMSFSGPAQNWVSSTNAIEHLRNNFNLSHDDKVQLDMLYGWYVMSDDDFTKLAQGLIVDKILQTRPDTLIIPCFDQDLSLSYETRQKLGITETGNCLTFLQKQYDELGMKDSNSFTERLDAIACHFTKEVSEVFTEAIYNKIKYNTAISCPTRIEHLHEVTHYYNKKL